MTTRFIVLFLGRSGSTYFMEALGSHPEIEVGFEELGRRRHLGAQEQLRFARSFFAPGDDNRAKGFKTKFQDILDPGPFSSLLREVGARVILLQRRNVVKSVVSWHRAEVLHEKTGDWNLYEAGGRPGPIHIDSGRFLERLKEYESARERLQKYAVGLELPTLWLYYEDVVRDAPTTFQMATSFLGVAGLDVRGRSVKLTSDDLSDAVTNVDELRASVDDGYRQMFDEELPESTQAP